MCRCVFTCHDKTCSRHKYTIMVVCYMIERDTKRQTKEDPVTTTAESKKTLRRQRRREDQERLGLIIPGEPELPDANTYSGFHHGTPRFVKDKAEAMAAKAALMYVRRKAEGDPDKTRTARGILRGQAQMLLLIRVPNLSHVPEYLKDVEEELVTKAQARLDKINS